ncbi:gfo/Idh/MocA family oxidoreductase [Curtobacterium sp. MCBD17_034]|uniref:Gfo/Idh/MocA family protein n=1 Tax=unclassified Curtobacterium TaxID=257496 RepID=UPI000DA79C00|nr:MULTISPECIES: Gfo/Idh/MocA family oxidoreductase [unclassified Curtobacterium]PZF56576.1 gfo/Idh/MocA family oxidoreductase [Curtobacterium sp. MCBD17_034]PZM33760.1 gfo/Idh/MocA family oxidoreductase [Curtobacterium sp. MCBD17_031]
MTITDTDRTDPAAAEPPLRTPAVATKRLPTVAPTRYALVGNGWRTEVYLRVAQLLPDRFRVAGVVTRRAEAGAELERRWGVPTWRTLDDLLAAERPEFVVPSVPWPVTPGLVRELVGRGVPVLTETPPAPDLDGMRSLWADVGAADLVQVAEQYLLMPLHAARLAAVRDGAVGVPTSVHVSSTHLYHAVSMIRGFLDVAPGPVTVRSVTSTAPLVDPITPDGWTHDTEPKPARTILSTLDLGDGRTGLYDFTDNQWWNPVRPDHLAVRGSTGELHDETLVRMLDATTPVTSRFERAQTGHGMDYEGLDTTHISLDGRPVWRNLYEGGRLMDDDLAVAELLTRTGAWTRDEAPAPYPLAEGLHDHHVGLAIEKAAGTGTAVTISNEPWVTSRA